MAAKLKPVPSNVTGTVSDIVVVEGANNVEVRPYMDIWLSVISVVQNS